MSAEKRRALQGGKVVNIFDERGIVESRNTCRTIARAIGFSVPDQTRLATAISELTRNLIQYAGSGTCEVFDESTPQFRRIGVQVTDEGPGISDIELAMKDGFSTGNGLGAGLACAKRLTHEMKIDSRPGRTSVYIALQRARFV